MKKESILFGIIGLFLGIIIAGTAAVIAVNTDNHSMMKALGMNMNHKESYDQSGDHADMSMDEMVDELSGLYGDAYDKSFITMMIAHHEGAINMAKLSDQRAKHNEIKELSEDIITAQEKEIADMNRWRYEWGYTDDELTNDMMHGGH